jgi:hypothetical protein
MKLVSSSAAEHSSYGAAVGDGIVDLGRRFGARHPPLRSAIAGDALADLAAEVETGLIGTLRNPIVAESRGAS